MPLWPMSLFYGNKLRPLSQGINELLKISLSTWRSSQKLQDVIKMPSRAPCHLLKHYHSGSPRALLGTRLTTQADLLLYSGYSGCLNSVLLFSLSHTHFLSFFVPDPFLIKWFSTDLFLYILDMFCNLQHKGLKREKRLKN